VDSAGNVWVTHNTTLGTVSRLSSTGIVLQTYYSAQLAGNTPLDIQFDSFGSAWISAWGSNSLMKMYSVGAPILQFLLPGSPWNLAVDNASTVWVTLSDASSVVRVANVGNEMGTYAVGSEPRGIAMDACKTCGWSTKETTLCPS